MLTFILARANVLQISWRKHYVLLTKTEKSKHRVDWISVEGTVEYLDNYRMKGGGKCLSTGKLEHLTILTKRGFPGEPPIYLTLVASQRLIGSSSLPITSHWYNLYIAHKKMNKLILSKLVKNVVSRSH